MKRLYARFVLWLIRPALSLQFESSKGLGARVILDAFAEVDTEHPLSPSGLDFIRPWLGEHQGEPPANLWKAEKFREGFKKFVRQ